jgi:hypothetical protein
MRQKRRETCALLTGVLSVVEGQGRRGLSPPKDDGERCSRAVDGCDHAVDFNTYGRSQTPWRAAAPHGDH